MNVFTTLKTIFFGSKVLSRPVPADGTPRRDLVIALNGLLPLCQAVPGMHLAVDIREGRAALVLDWTPRTDEKALDGAYHYVVSNEGGVEEVAESQFLLTENGKSNPLESKGVSSQHPASLKVEKEVEAISSAAFKNVEKETKAIFPEVSKDVEKKTKAITPITSKGVESQFNPAVSKAVDKRQAKSRTLMQEVAAFLTSHYRFRFNVLTEETEVAAVESSIPDSHLRYAKVDERWMNSLSLEAIEAGIDCWDRGYTAICALAPHR